MEQTDPSLTARGKCGGGELCSVGEVCVNLETPGSRAGSGIPGGEKVRYPAELGFSQGHLELPGFLFDAVGEVVLMLIEFLGESGAGQT